MVDLIIAGDLHAGNLSPECRSDCYIDALLHKLKWIGELQEQYDVPIIFPGDIFDHWSGGGTEIINKVIAAWPKGIVYTVPGQHDLPQHNITLQGKTAYQNLILAGKIIDLSTTSIPLDGFTLHGAAWGHEPPVPGNGISVLVWHITTWQTPFKPGDVPGDAERLLQKYQKYDLIVTGDNHQTFTVDDVLGRKLLNAGSVMRITAAQIDHKPCVYLWRNSGIVETLYIPITDVVSREHVDKAKDKEERKNAFVTRLSGNTEISLSFDDNIKKCLETESLEVQQVVLECTGK